MKELAKHIGTIGVLLGIVALLGLGVYGCQTEKAEKAAGWEAKWYADTVTNSALSAARRAYGLRDMAWPPGSDDADVNVAVGGDSAFLGSRGGDAYAGDLIWGRWDVLEYAAAVMAGRLGVTAPRPIPADLVKAMEERFKPGKYTAKYIRLRAVMTEYRLWFECLPVKEVEQE